MTARPADLPDDPLPPCGSRIDLHCHSSFSADGIGTLDEIAIAAKSKGLDGVCLTEHDTTRHHAVIRRWNEDHAGEGFQFFPGVEVTTDQGHVLGIGLLNDIPAKLPLLEAVQRIHDHGAVAIPAHPWRFRTGIGDEGLATLEATVVAIEVWNAQEIRGGNRRAATWAVEHRRSGTGGSDAHQVHDVGNGYTEFREKVERLDQLLAALRAGNVWGVGHRTPFSTLLRQGTRNTLRRISRRARGD